MIRAFNPTPEDLAVLIHPSHHHVEEDTWYCCGACVRDGEEDCLDHTRRGRCDCRLAERRQETADKIHAALKREREKCAIVATLHSRYPLQNDEDRAYDQGRKDSAAAIRSMRRRT